MNFFKKSTRVNSEQKKNRKVKRRESINVWGLNRTQRKQWEFLMQVMRTLGNCFGALFALLALYLTYRIYMNTVMGV